MDETAGISCFGLHSSFQHCWTDLLSRHHHGQFWSHYLFCSSNWLCWLATHLHGVRVARCHPETEEQGKLNILTRTLVLRLRETQEMISWETAGLSTLSPLWYNELDRFLLTANEPKLVPNSDLLKKYMYISPPIFWQGKNNESPGNGDICGRMWMDPLLFQLNRDDG